MRISQPSDNSAVTSSNAAASAVKNGPTASTQAKSEAVKSAPSAGVAVTVSQQARLIGADAADVDTAKVKAVQLAIKQGTYVVNAEAIADKLLSNAQDELERSRR